jgi:hypothetical protein
MPRWDELGELHPVEIIHQARAGRLGLHWSGEQGGAGEHEELEAGCHGRK